MFTARELTEIKKKREMYQDLKNSYTNYGHTQYPNNKTKINTFKSYSERLDLKKGKFYSNTPICAIDNVKYEIEAGSLMKLDYGNNSVLIATGNLDISNGKIVAPDNTNLIPYPSNTVEYPGFIVDPNHSIFTNNCGEQRSQYQTWVKNLTTTGFEDTNQWRKLNSVDSLHNFDLKGGINLWSEFNVIVTRDSDNGAYIMNGLDRHCFLVDRRNPTLYFNRQDIINFIVNIDDSSHKFRINTEPYTGDFNDKLAPGVDPRDGVYGGQIMTWQPSVSGKYYYNCANHTTMQGEIIIEDGGSGGSTGSGSGSGSGSGYSYSTTTPS